MMTSKRKLLVFICFALATGVATAAKYTDDEIGSAISQSDDYSNYQSAFIAATRSLAESGRCTLAELKNMGGWVKSQSYKDRPVYFTYCGGMTVKNRIMLDASTGRIFK